MKLPKDVRARFQRHGQRGGRIRAERLTAEERRGIARHAGIRRWIRARFKETRFEALGLPGGALIDQGLEDLARHRETLDALTVCLAAARLRREGVPVPATDTADPERRLYRLLEETSGELAHARYLARLRQVASFADACHAARIEPNRHAQ